MANVYIINNFMENYLIILVNLLNLVFYVLFIIFFIYLATKLLIYLISSLFCHHYY